MTPATIWQTSFSVDLISVSQSHPRHLAQDLTVAPRYTIQQLCGALHSKLNPSEQDEWHLVVTQEHKNLHGIKWENGKMGSATLPQANIRNFTAS